MLHAAERSRLSVLAGLTIAYAAAVVILSSLKLLWLDELITLFLVRSGSPASIWSALRLGADPNPPFSYFCVLLSTRLFGDGALALRLPAAVGYWIGLAALFLYLRRRVPPVWALAGTVLSTAMAAFDYSFESRSYGLMYGLAMLSFLLWSLAVEPGTSRLRRAMLLAGMSASLLLGICTNYFAVLALLPVAVGEAVRISTAAPREQRDRTVYPAVWIGLLIALLPLLLFRPLIAHAVALYAPYAWNRVSFAHLLSGYTEVVESTLLPLLAVAAFAGFLLWQARRSRSGAGNLSLAARFAAQKSLLPLHEAAAVAAFAAYPVLGYVAASIYGGMLSARFVLPVCFGFAIGGTVILCRMAARSRMAGAALLCLCGAWFVARESYVGATYAAQRSDFWRVEGSLSDASRDAEPGSLIAVPDPLLAVALEHYGRPSLHQRLAFPVDFAAVRRFRHDDSPEQNLWAGRALLPGLRIESLADFQNEAGNYLILAAENNWLLQDLQQRHDVVTRLPVQIHADNIGGFTPLAHGMPEIFQAQGSARVSTAESRMPRLAPFTAGRIQTSGETNP